MIQYVYAIGLMYEDNNIKKYKRFNINLNTNDENLEYESLEKIKEYLLFIKKNISHNNKKYVSFHNLSGFDGIFILKCINKFFINEKKKRVLIRSGKVYKISI